MRRGRRRYSRREEKKEERGEAREEEKEEKRESRRERGAEVLKGALEIQGGGEDWDCGGEDWDCGGEDWDCGGEDWDCGGEDWDCGGEDWGPSISTISTLARGDPKRSRLGEKSISRLNGGDEPGSTLLGPGEKRCSWVDRRATRGFYWLHLKDPSICVMPSKQL
ncbi:hypothetical protein NHX12_031074, partial [Muraenolepis orangiensis]